MPRRNQRAYKPRLRRETPVNRPPRGATITPPPAIESLVIPRGRCYFGNRHGKLSFAVDDVDKALAQARAARERKGSGYAESRAYECPDGGCGHWHLTSRETWTPRGQG